MSVGSVVIIGGGQAGAQAAFSLRQWGFEAPITIIGEEPALPYQRPPLSKAYMKGEVSEERLYMKPRAWYDNCDVDLKLGVRASSIDPANKIVMLANGQLVSYTHLIIATGSRARPMSLEGSDAKHVFSLRTISDVEQIKPQMKPGKRLVIVGAGYIGLEAAAVAKQLGLEVTVLEMADRVLARVTSPVMSNFFESEHRSNGVNIRTGAGLSRFDTDNGLVQAARLTDGTVIPCDLALIGIGILPNQELAEAAGLACENGIVVNRDAQTSNPHIFAVGDCSKRPLVHYDQVARLESVHNALEQAKIAAAKILERDRPIEDCPWFWSDQYDLKLQIAGLSQGYDDLVIRGDPAARKFAVFYLRDGQLIAVDAINSAPEFLVAKKLIVSKAKPDPQLLKDGARSMKEVAAAIAA